MGFFQKMRRFLNRHAVKGMINYVCAFQAMGLVLYLIAPGLLNYLMLHLDRVFAGGNLENIYIFNLPPAFTGGSTMGLVLFNVLAIYCIHIFGTIVEQVWGAFRFNCYIILGVLLNVAVSVLFYLFTGFPLILTPLHLVYSFFFVFALMFRKPR